MKRIWIVGSLLAMSAALGAQDEKPFNRDHHPWLRWKARTTVKLVMTLGKDKTDMIQTLKESSDSGYTAEWETSAFGTTAIFTEKEGTPKRDGQETLTLDGRKVECTIWKATAERHEQEAESRYWIDGQGRLLKVEKTVDMNKGTTTLHAVKSGEKITIKGREYHCLKLEGTCRAPTGGEGKLTQWFTTEIPGGVAKATVTYAGGAGPATLSLAVVGFEAAR